MAKAIPDELYLAIDGSMSGTRALLFSPKEEFIVYEELRMGIHFRKMELKTFYMPLQNTIDGLFSKLASPYDEAQVQISKKIRKIAITIAGLDERFDPSSLVTHFHSIPGLNAIPDNVIIRGIGEATHRATFTSEGGIVVRCGMGCTVFGAQKDGDKHFTNAWGYLGASDGSGFSIGQMALNCIARTEDGRASAGEKKFAKKLSAKIAGFRSAIGFFESCQMNRFLHSHQASNIISGLSHHVFSIAQDGDTIASQILDKVSDDIFEGIVAVNTRLGLSDLNSLNLAFRGGVIDSHPSFSKHLYKKVVNKYPNSTVCPGGKYPRRIIGTALLALGYKSNNDRRFRFNGQSQSLLDSIIYIDQLHRKFESVWTNKK